MAIFITIQNVHTSVSATPVLEIYAVGIIGQVHKFVCTGMLILLLYFYLKKGNNLYFNSYLLGTVVGMGLQHLIRHRRSLMV